MVMRDGSAGCFILPVGIIFRRTVCIEQTFVCEYLWQISCEVLALKFVGIFQSLLEGRHPFVSIHYVYFSSHLTDRQWTIIGNMDSFSCITALGSHHDNTIRTTGTIDGSRGSIFQYFDRFDIIRIKQFEVWHHHSIDYVQRWCRCVDSRNTTNDDTWFSTRLTGIREDIHTGHFTLQSVKRIEWLCFQHVFTFGCGNGTRQVWFAHGTITYNDYFVQCFRIRLQNYVQNITL